MEDTCAACCKIDAVAVVSADRAESCLCWCATCSSVAGELPCSDERANLIDDSWGDVAKAAAALADSRALDKRFAINCC